MLITTSEYSGGRCLSIASLYSAHASRSTPTRNALYPIGSMVLRKCSATNAAILATRSGLFIMFLQRDGALQHLVQFLDVADPLGLQPVQELPLQGFPVNEQVIGRKLVMQRHRGPVRDRLADRILVQVALLVIGAEHLECALAVRRPVDGRAGEAEVRRVGQRAHEVVSKVAARRSVRLIHQNEDVFTRFDVGADVIELVDHGDDQAAPVGR